MADEATYRATADSAWRWVLDQVRWDDGPWIPATVVAGEEPVVPPLRDGMHSGIGGLAHVLAEVRLSRRWTTEEAELADAIAERLRREIPTSVDATYFDGLVSTLGALTALRAPGSEDVVARLAALATDDGWPQTSFDKFGPDARINDLTLGTAGVVLAGLWGDAQGVEGGRAMAEHAADVLLAESEPTAAGAFWRFVPARFREGGEMPNLSHGLAGIALTLALAGDRLGRRDLVDAAVSGAEHLVSLGELRGDGFVVPRYLPRDLNDEDEVTYTWCHGAAGTSLLFRALDHVGVDAVAGEPPAVWRRRFLHSVRTSGLPERGPPGFWDNDGRCCGTAGVGDVFLDAWQCGASDHRTDDLVFARICADALVERAVREGRYAYWRFVEHRADDPLLPPGVGWMQGAAGIAAYLFRVARILEQAAEAERLSRMDNWWALARP
jgi:hypothetical protein